MQFIVPKTIASALNWKDQLRRRFQFRSQRRIYCMRILEAVSGQDLLLFLFLFLDFGRYLGQNANISNYSKYLAANPLLVA